MWSAIRASWKKTRRERSRRGGPPLEGGEALEELLERYTGFYRKRGDLKTIQKRLNMFDADYIFASDVMFVGSPAEGG